MRRRFFVEQFEAKSATLSGEGADHLGRVLRAERGQLYELSDGQRVWLGRIERVALAKHGESRVEFALLEPIAASEPGLRIELLLSLVKFDRFEWSLEKATELGVAAITPVIAARADKPLIAAAGKRRARWEKILLESAQQSRRLRPPEIGEAISAERAFAQAQAGCKVLLSESCEAPPLRQVLSRAGVAGSFAFAIGPEGGWTEKETQAAQAEGFAEASLGENILRAETAVIAALAVARFVLGQD